MPGTGGHGGIREPNEGNSGGFGGPKKLLGPGGWWVPQKLVNNVEETSATNTRIIWFIISALAGVVMLTLTSIIGYEMSQISSLTQQGSERSAQLAVVQSKLATDEQRTLADESRMDNLNQTVNNLQRQIPAPQGTR